MRNSGKALHWGSCAGCRMEQNKEQVPLLLPQGEGGAYSLYGLNVGVCPAEGVRLEEGLRRFAHPFVVLSARHMCGTLFLLLALQKWQFWWVFFFVFFFFLVFLYLFVQNLPQVHTRAVILSPILFLCILARREVCPGTKHCRTAAKSHRTQSVSLSQEKDSRKQRFLDCAIS